MRLTSFTDYALRALMRMASAPDQSYSTAELAEEFKISRNHLTKAIAALSAAGIVKTRRGNGGGASLARPADRLRLGDIVAVLEERSVLVECLAAQGGTCVITPSCRLKGVLVGAQKRFIEDLNKVSLADVALTPRGGDRHVHQL